MKSLIKDDCRCDAKPKPKPEAPDREKAVAQCCAKVSKVVAGCHD